LIYTHPQPSKTNKVNLHPHSKSPKTKNEVYPIPNPPKTKKVNKKANPTTLQSKNKKVNNWLHLFNFKYDPYSDFHS
jgi:hypothetical protein